MPAFEPMRQLVVTSRLTLRSWRPSDSAALRALWAERDPRSLRVIDADGHPTEPEMRDRIESQLAESNETGVYLLAIERTGESAVLGYCGLLIGSASEDEPEIGYELLRSAHGHGYATEAAQAIVDEPPARVEPGSGPQCGNGTRRHSGCWRNLSSLRAGESPATPNGATPSG